MALGFINRHLNELSQQQREILDQDFDLLIDALAQRDRFVVDHVLEKYGIDRNGILYELANRLLAEDVVSDYE